MKKLTDIEQRFVSRMAENGGSYCPHADTLAHPDAIAILKSLKSKKRIYEIEDTDLPTFRLTQAGWNDAEAVNAQA